MGESNAAYEQAILALPEPTGEERLRMEAAMWKRRCEAAEERLIRVTSELAAWALRPGGMAWELKETPKETARRLVRIAQAADYAINQVLLEGGLSNSTAEDLGLHELLEALTEPNEVNK